MAQENRFAKYRTPQQGAFVQDPRVAAQQEKDARAAEAEAERLRIAREQLTISQRNATISQQNADTTARNANKPPPGYTFGPNGLAFIPGGPADPEVIAAAKAAAADATASAKKPAADPDRAAQILTALENINQLRAMAGESLAVGKLSGRVGDWPVIGSVLGQNRADVEGALKMVEGDLIQQQIAKLSAANGGNGVATMANSETEAARMAASVANLDPNQNAEQFQIGLDRAEAFYRRQLDAMKAASGVPEPMKAAGAGATQAGIPIPAEMQAEHAAYLAKNWGNLDPDGYAQFREGLDRKYDFEPRMDAYRAIVPDLNERAASGGAPEGLNIPPVTYDLNAREQANNDFASSGAGRAAAAFANGVGGGAVTAFAPEQMALMRDESNGEMFAGDLLGSMVGTGAIGKGLGLAAKAASGAPRVASLLANPLTADLAYSGLYGGNEGGPAGIVTGMTGAIAGNAAGKKIGQALGRKAAGPDPLNAGERAVQTVTGGKVDPVVAALAQADQLGVPMTLADASPELQSLAGSATRFSPTTAGTARSVMAMRNQGQVDRLANAVERDLGPVTNIPQRSVDLQKQAKANAGPLYKEAYAAPGAETVDLSDLQDRPEFAPALREAYNEVLSENLDPSAMGLQGVGDGIMIASPSWQSLDYVKRGLDNIIEQNTSKIDGVNPAGRRAIDMKNILLGRMDAANPAYADARRAYAGPMQERSFLGRGEDAINTRPDQLGVDMAGLTPEQQAQMRLGYQSELMGRAGDVRNNGNPFAQLNTPNTEGRLNTLYGGAEGADIPRLLAQRDLELQLAGSANRLIGNSATAEREIADEFFRQAPAPIGGDIAQGVAETALLGGPFLTVGKRVGDRFLRDRREAAALAANRSLADELGPILFNDAPTDAAAALTDIGGRAAAYDPVLEALMGRYGAMAGHVGALSGAIMGGGIPR